MRHWVELGQDQLDWKLVVSTIGARNSVDTGSGYETVTLKSVDALLTNQDTVSRDMIAYQKFKITGTSIKVSFNPPTTQDVTPITWQSAYSANKVMTKEIGSAQKQGMQSYQAGGVKPS